MIGLNASRMLHSALKSQSMYKNPYTLSSMFSFRKLKNVHIEVHVIAHNIIFLVTFSSSHHAFTLSSKR
jgi:hypothetical protein